MTSRAELSFAIDVSTAGVTRGLRFSPGEMSDTREPSALAFPPSPLLPESDLPDDYATFRRRTGKDLYDGVPLCGS
jgi:hypothetical protein